MTKEKALVNLLFLESAMTKEANSAKDVTKRTATRYEKALKDFCEMVGLNIETVERNLKGDE